MDSKENFVVIGHGLAGVTSAIRAKDLGANVTLIASRDGATALSSGAFDICRDPMGVPGDIFGWERNWQKNIKTLLTQNPNHPYSLTPSTKIIDAIQHIARSLESIDFSLKINDEKNHLLSTPVGTWKETAGAQGTQVGFDLFDNRVEHITILKLKQNRNFMPELLRERLREFIFTKSESNVSINVLELDLGLPINIPDLAIAEMLEQGLIYEKFLELLNNVVKKERPSLILVPPILGLDESGKIAMELSKEVGAPIVETLGYYESTPGIRLQRALMRLLERKGIRVIKGEVINFSSKSTKIESVIVKDYKGEVCLKVGETVLATGKWIGGGVVHQNSLPIKEAIFNLPLRVDNKFVNETKPFNLYSQNYFDRHKSMRIGIKVNSILQPLGYKGEVIYDNLRAVGSILTGYDPHADGCGSGVAVVTGYLAAEYGTSG